MKDCVNTALKNVSWECTHCGLPNFYSALFDLSLFETSNTYESLRQDQADYDISFNCPQATSSPKQTWKNNRSNSQHLQDGLCSDSTASGTVEAFTHPSFRYSSEPQKIQRSQKQRDDIQLKVLVVNCQSISGLQETTTGKTDSNNTA